MKKITSVNRIEANRRNARKSTGPKSAGGKAMSRMNAFKHGLLAQEVPATEAEGLSAEALKAKRQERLLEFLDEQLVCCEAGLREIGELHGWTKQVRLDASLLLGRKTMDRILRYETNLERQMYRAMSQLERLQRLRKGEVVPAPLAIQVT